MTTTDTAAPSARTRPSYRTARTTRRAVRVMIAVSVLAGAAAGAAPSGLWLADVVVAGSWAGLVTAAASRARRGSTLWMAGVAALGVEDPVLLGVAALAVAVAFLTAWLPDRERALGALTGLLALQVLLRLDLGAFHGASALVAAIAVAPVLVSGYRMARAREQRLARRAAAVAVGLVGVAGLLFALTVARGRAQIDRGVDLAHQGLAAIRDGDQDRGAALLSRSAAAFDQAAGTFASPIGYPARLVPALGHQAAATRTMSDAGAEVADAAVQAATAAAYDDLAIEGGQVDLDLLERMIPPLQASHDALVEAQDRLVGVGNPWLIPPLADPLDRFSETIADTLPEAEVALRAAEVAPWLLGGDAARHYFVAFATPAETRGMGGFVGSYGLLTAREGHVELTLSGRIAELSGPGSEERTLSGPPEYLDRYGRYFPASNLQNVTASPDLPTVARVLAELYPQTGGANLDGVLYVDPHGLAALLRLTGPVRVEGIAAPLDAATVAELLLVDQYLDYPDRSGREEVLADATEATFEALTSRSLPAPARIVDALSPAVREGHLAFAAFDTDASSLLADQGIDGAFPDSEGGDLLSVRSANANPSKIDAYLHRRTGYDVRYDPVSGALEATLTVELRNEAPASGLPPSVIGNRRRNESGEGPPMGTNRMQLSIYTPHQVASATIDGAPLPLGHQPELGVSTYNALVEIPPGATLRLAFELVGTIEPGPYRLVVAGQALAHPDQVDIGVEPAAGWEISTVDSSADAETEVRDRRVQIGTSTNADQQVVVEFGR